MSGGIAYVWDVAGDFSIRCNLGMVVLEDVVAEEDIAELLEMVELHQQVTGSTVAERLLNDWTTALRQFVKVMPIDYQRVLQARRQHDEEMEAAVHSEAPHQH
jgi:glutamate synthase (NADPH/NADH) large chain